MQRGRRHRRRIRGPTVTAGYALERAKKLRSIRNEEEEEEEEEGAEPRGFNESSSLLFVLVQPVGRRIVSGSRSQMD
ncbi:hypothetical protein EYF80_022636 [Liparis tanakae]|uniref:Uncharacterized protein n=1 Tax=Liparis tanakae TaxID=230148 RepID=A0A4Z2HMN0_9TELE|nr:hypothetical protein EYF80_022636 [Liparis tanakae]